MTYTPPNTILIWLLTRDNPMGYPVLLPDGTWWQLVDGQPVQVTD